MSEIISVTNATRVNSYRGTQVVTDNLSVQAGSRVSLTGFVSNGVPSPDFTICRKFDAFLGGQPQFSNICPEIVKIPLDSSSTISVRLYDCSNKSINVDNIQAAFITFNSAFTSPMVVNRNSESLEYLISTSDQILLAKGKVYDMLIRVVDENGNQSIILSRKVRFN